MRGWCKEGAWPRLLEAKVKKVSAGMVLGRSFAMVAGGQVMELR